MTTETKPIEPTEQETKPVEPQEDTSGLKSALEKERQARKDAEKEAKRLKDEREELERKTLEEKEDFKKLWETDKQKLEELKNKVKEKDINSELKSIAATITKDGNKRDDIIALYKNYAQHTDNGVVFVVSGMEVTKEQLIEKIKEDRPYLVDGSQASGGGAAGGSGGATGKTMKREAFNQLSPQKQQEFTFAGGKIIR